jgi:uncharacterized protein (DUF1501 family)
MSFNRREFLKISALASAGLFIPGFIKASGKSFYNGSLNGKILVVIQLSGGNDGLNTVIPFSNDIYYKSRPKISIKKSDVLKLNDELGFHPSLNGLKTLYDQGYVSIINEVGYPNPDRSHFRSMDIWQTASSSNEYLNTGWVGRYLDSECNGCNNSYIAIEADETISLALKGKNKTGIAFQDIQRFYRMSNKKLYVDIQNNSRGDRKQNEAVDFLYKTLADSTSNAKMIYEKSRIYKSKQTYPGTQLSKNLKMIAELIMSGLETKIYYTSFTGFDTHVNQLNKQSDLLKQYSEGIKAFTDDLKQNNKFKDVVIITFSEFGRRVSENASGGTDHGTANNVFLISGGLKKSGITNPPPDLTNLDNGDLKFKVDFRSIYQNLLNDWLGVNPSKVLYGKFEKLDLL